ncbi:MAG: hypothetical protein GF364_04235, partial [Candidatus Lokiarchaeota archaeon]|nr:hypothetical protein [Candidatus Lokiarchaeota archaeon]
MPTSKKNSNGNSKKSDNLEKKTKQKKKSKSKSKKTSKGKKSTKKTSPKATSLMDFMSKSKDKRLTKSKMKPKSKKEEKSKKEPEKPQSDSKGKKVDPKKKITIESAFEKEEKTDVQKKSKKKALSSSDQVKEETKGRLGNKSEQESIKKKSTEFKKEDQLKFYKKDDTPFGESAFDEKPEKLKREAHKSRYLRYLMINNQICDNMERGILLTMEYCGTQNKAYAKFYDLDDHCIKFWIDTTNHRPYCLHKDSKEKLEKNPELTEYEGFNGIETEKIYDLMEDKEIEVSKVYGFTPRDIASGQKNIKTILDGAWEANIRYHHNFIYDRQLIPGLLYKIKDGKITPIELDIEPEIEKEFLELYKDEKAEFQDIAKKYLKIFSYPIPDIRRVAFDIEVAAP